MICQNSISFAQFDNGLSPAITEMVFINKPLKPLSRIRSGAVVNVRLDLMVFLWNALPPSRGDVKRFTLCPLNI